MDTLMPLPSVQQASPKPSTASFPTRSSSFAILSTAPTSPTAGIYSSLSAELPVKADNYETQSFSSIDYNRDPGKSQDNFGLRKRQDGLLSEASEIGCDSDDNDDGLVPLVGHQDPRSSIYLQSTCASTSPLPSIASLSPLLVATFDKKHGYKIPMRPSIAGSGISRHALDATWRQRAGLTGKSDSHEGCPETIPHGCGNRFGVDHHAQDATYLGEYQKTIIDNTAPEPLHTNMDQGEFWPGNVGTQPRLQRDSNLFGGASASSRLVIELPEWSCEANPELDFCQPSFVAYEAARTVGPKRDAITSDNALRPTPGQTPRGNFHAERSARFPAYRWMPFCKQGSVAWARRNEELAPITVTIHDDRLLKGASSQTGGSLRVLRSPSVKPLLPWLVLAAGGISVIYSAAMAATAKILESPMWAPPFAYAEGLIAVVVFTALADKSFPPLKSWRKGMRDTRAFVGSNPWRHAPVLIGGVLGGSIGIVAAYVPSVIGMGPFFVMFVTGQVLAAMIMDKTGWFWATRTPANRWVLAGNLLVILGASIFQWSSFGTLGQSRWGNAASSVGGSFLAGLFAVVQGGINCRMTKLLGADARTALWSLSTGLVVLSSVAVVVNPRPKFENYCILNYPADLWKLLGGFLAVSSLLTIMVMPRFLGFALTTCWMVAGELIASLIVDHFGLLELAERRANGRRVFGITLVMCGVVAIQMLKPSQIQNNLKSGERKVSIIANCEGANAIATSLSQREIQRINQPRGGVARDG